MHSSNNSGDFLAQATQYNHKVSSCNFSPLEPIPETHLRGMQQSQDIIFEGFQLVCHIQTTKAPFG